MAVRSWQGVRREESAARARLPERGPWKYRKMDGPCEAYRPLLDWTPEDVWAMHDCYGFVRNPAYDEGAKRVGCAPCIFSAKQDLRVLASSHPEEIDRIREWEALVSQASKYEVPLATMLHTDNIFGSGRKDNLEIRTQDHGIDAQVMWSTTKRGCRQRDIFLSAEVFGPCTNLGVCES